MRDEPRRACICLRSCHRCDEVPGGAATHRRWRPAARASARGRPLGVEITAPQAVLQIASTSSSRNLASRPSRDRTAGPLGPRRRTSIRPTIEYWLPRRCRLSSSSVHGRFRGFAEVKARSTPCSRRVSRSRGDANGATRPFSGLLMGDRGTRAHALRRPSEPSHDESAHVRRARAESSGLLPPVHGGLWTLGRHSLQSRGRAGAAGRLGSGTPGSSHSLEPRPIDRTCRDSLRVFARRRPAPSRRRQRAVSRRIGCAAFRRSSTHRSQPISEFQLTPVRSTILRSRFARPPDRRP